MGSTLKILVLGATGIIGRYLCEVAAAEGHLVSAVSRGNPRIRVDGVEYLQGDARDPGARRTLVSSGSFDAVVDLLSFTPEHVTESLEWFSGRCEQYVLISSATVYEAPRPGERLTENASLRNSGWEYPLRKIACEKVLRTRAAEIGQVFTIVRPYITYSEQRLAFGAWEGEQALARIRNGLPVVIGDEISGTQTALTHSRDLARGIVSLLGNPRAINEDFHIAAENMHTWREVYEIASDLLGVRLDVVDAPVSRIVDVYPELAGKLSDRMLDRSFDLTKFRGASPGFDFEYTLRDGYQTVLDAWGPPAPLAAQWRGRMDRLIAEVGALSPTPQSRSELDLRTVGQMLRYVIGRSRLLFAVHRRLRWRQP